MEDGKTEVSPEVQTDPEHENSSLLDIVDTKQCLKSLLESLDEDPSPGSKPIRFIPSSKSRYISQITSDRWKVGITYSIFGESKSEEVLVNESFEEGNLQETECQSSIKQRLLKTPGTPMMEEYYKTEDTAGRKSPDKSSEEEKPMAQEPPEKCETTEKEEPMEQGPPEKHKTAGKDETAVRERLEKEEPMSQEPFGKQDEFKKELQSRENERELGDICSEESIVIFEYDLQSREQRKETEAKNKWYFQMRTTIFPDLLKKYTAEREGRKKGVDTVKVSKRPETTPAMSPKGPSSNSDPGSPKNKCPKASTSTGSKRKKESISPGDVKQRSPKKSSSGQDSDRDGPKSESPTASIMTRSKRKAGSTSPADVAKHDEKKKRTSEES